MSSIIDNQRSAFINTAMSDLGRAAQSLNNLTPAQRAACIATLLAATQTPADVVMLCDDTQEMHDAAAMVDGVLPRAISAQYTWRVSGDAQFALISLNKDSTHV